MEESKMMLFKKKDGFARERYVASNKDNKIPVSAFLGSQSNV